MEDCSGILVVTLSILSISLDYKTAEFNRLLFFYFLFDMFMFKKKMDIVLHHIIAISAYINVYLFSISQNEFMELFRVIIWVETSNIFLLSKKMVLTNNQPMKWAIDLGFVCSFIYFRIYYYYFHILAQNKLFDVIVEKYTKTQIQYASIWFTVYGFYILNLYWLCLILNKIYAKIHSSKKENIIPREAIQ